MKHAATLTALLAVAGAATALGPPARSGWVEGTVRFTGPVPPARKLETIDGVLLHRDLVVDRKTKGLRDVVVSLEGAPAAPPARSMGPAEMDQRDLMFVPRVLAVRAGQPVQFDNSDRCNHSVMAASTTPANNFNLFVDSGRPVTRSFAAQRPPVRIGCSLHAWMRAWVYVFPHGHFAVSGAAGKFRIAHVPPGKYSLLFRHADTGLSERRAVEVRAGRATRVEVEWKKAAASDDE